jgi:hypothetical protein
MYLNQASCPPGGKPVPTNHGGQTQIGGYGFQKPEVGHNVVRIPKVIYQDSGTSTEVVTPGNTLFKIRLPSNGTYDFRESMLKFDLRMTKTGGTYIRLVNGAWNVLNRFRHLQGGNCVEERQDWNETYNLKWLARQQPDVVSNITSLLGIGTTTQRNTWGATTRSYAMPVDVGFLNAGILPFGEVDPGHCGLAGAHDLEFYLNLPAHCVETDGTDVKIYISNIRWHVEKIEGLEWERQLCNFFRSGSASISYKMVDKYQSPLQTITQTVPISHRSRYVDSIVGTVVNLNDLQDMASTTLNRHWNYPKSNMISYQFKDAPLRGANSIYPAEIVDTTGDAERAYLFYMQWVRSWKSSGFSQDAPVLTSTNFNGTAADEGKFLIVGDFRSNRPVDESHNHIVNLQSADNLYNDIKLDVRFSSAPASGLAINFFIFYTVVHNVNREGYIELQMADLRFGPK